MIARRYIWPGYAGLLCLVAGLCFGNLRTHLLDTHDAETFRDHLRIQQDWTLFFSPDKEQASGRPTAEAVKYLVFLLCGNDPAAFHLLSIAIHTLAALLLARVVFCLGNSAILAGLTGLLFLVNVTHFQAIHHISALDYPLALCCGLAALLMLGRGTTPKRSAVFAALLALGVLAHPSIAVVWTLAGYLLWRRSDLTAALGALWPSGLVLAAAFFATLQLAADNTSTWQAVDEYGAQSAVDLVLGMLRVLWWFCSRLLTTAHWLPLPIYVRQTWELALGAALCALLLWLVWRSKEPLAAAALATLLGLMPYLLLTEATILGLPAGPSRYLYLASAGSSLLLAWLFDQLRRRIHGYLAAALLVGLLASSYHALRQVEAVSFYTSARSYSASKEYDAAREQFRRALAHERAVIPTADAYVRFCLLLMDSGEDHIPLLAEALAAHPENRQLRLYQLATAATDTAAAFRERAMQLAMDQRYTAASDGEIIAKALHNLGAGFRRKKEPARVMLAYQQALRIAPDRFKTLKDLTFAHWQLAAQWAERIDAENPAPQTELVARFRRQIDAAISTGQRALGLRPDADLYYQLGKIYQQLGQRQEALAAYRQTLAQNPDYARAYQRMAEIYTQQGDQDAAARALQTASTRPNANPPSPQPDR